MEKKRAEEGRVGRRRTGDRKSKGKGIGESDVAERGDGSMADDR